MLCLPARERDCRASLPHGAIDMCLAAGYLPSGTSKLSATELELLTRATCRCSASTAARVVGASSLGAAELRCMQSELHALQATLTHQGADSTTAEGAVRPPESGALSGSALHPNFGRLRELAPVDQLKGEDVEKPIVMPVELSLVPDEVHSLQDVSNALQHACYCCTLLSNQHGLVRDSFALRVGLITHLFLRVLPHPLPPGSDLGQGSRRTRSPLCSAGWIFSAATLPPPRSRCRLDAPSTRRACLSSQPSLRLSMPCCASKRTTHPPRSRCTMGDM